jgi:hypothetical protein
MRRVGMLAVVLLPLCLLVANVSTEAGEHSYVGTKNCKKCHIKEWKSWGETKMAEAYESLKPGIDAEAKTTMGLDPEMDYTTDASCVECHVTGYGAEGGFTSIEETPDLAGIGCEMCHGPGGTYTQDEYMSLKNKEYKRAEVVAVGMVEMVSETQCVVCHNENVPIEGYTFNFDEAKDKGTHEKYPLKYNHD